jgi:hypothetical protein
MVELRRGIGNWNDCVRQACICESNTYRKQICHGKMPDRSAARVHANYENMTSMATGHVSSCHAAGVPENLTAIHVEDMSARACWHTHGLHGCMDVRINRKLV